MLELRTVALFAFAALVLTACGSSSNPSGNSKPSATADPKAFARAIAHARVEIAQANGAESAGIRLLRHFKPDESLPHFQTAVHDYMRAREIVEAVPTPKRERKGAVDLEHALGDFAAASSLDAKTAQAAQISDISETSRFIKQDAGRLMAKAYRELHVKGR